MNRYILLFLLFPLHAYAICPADDVELLKSSDISTISKVRQSYDWSSGKPDAVSCYYKILKIEAELSIIKNDYVAAEIAAEEILASFPEDSWGMLYMQIALKGQNKQIPKWYSNKRMPNGYTNDAFIKYLSSQLVK